jgi:tRNA-Thr(GGU) m(6)t(6)A37 methyltransferase TsaA
MGTTKDFGIREGEKAVELPGQPDASLYFIGRIHTPWKERKDCPKNARESEAVCTVDVDPRWRDGLKDVETCSHLMLLYWMDKSPRDLVLQVPGHYGAQHGTFALRSPARPNPVAVSVVKLLRVEGNKLSTVSTVRRSLISSRTSLPPTAYRTPWWAGTRAVAQDHKFGSRSHRSKRDRIVEASTSQPVKCLKA